MVCWNCRLTRSPAFTANGCAVSEQLELVPFVVTEQVILVGEEASIAANVLPLNTVKVMVFDPFAK